MIRTYKELSQLKTFEERFNYLKLGGIVGEDTFGFDRYLNQMFYRSMDWRSVRDKVIIRDNGCDLGVEGYDIRGQKIYVHHMNPLRRNDIVNTTEYLLNPDYLITVTFQTHNAIHYGDETILPFVPVERYANDTCPWKN